MTALPPIGDLKVFPNWYAGIRNIPEDGELYPLAFITHDTGDSAFRKRKESVDQWVGDGDFYDSNLRRRVKNDAKPVFKNFENIPTKGFTFSKAVTRWTTDNKMFRINDPRGFQIEISAANTTEILLNHTVEKGEIIGELIYARLGGNLYLTRPNSERIFKEERLSKAKTIDVGDIVLHANKQYVKIGTGHVNALKSLGEATHYPARGRSFGQGGSPSYWSTDALTRLPASAGKKLEEIQKTTQEGFCIAVLKINDLPTANIFVRLTDNENDWDRGRKAVLTSKEWNVIGHIDTLPVPTYDHYNSPGSDYYVDASTTNYNTLDYVREASRRYGDRNHFYLRRKSDHPLHQVRVERDGDYVFIIYHAQL